MGANPQGGELAPIVSLPLCSESCHMGADPITGHVTFSYDSMMIVSMPPVTDVGEDAEEADGATEYSDTQVVHHEGSNWPMDLYTFGTGFDAYILNGSGDDVVGPVMFNIQMY